VRLHRENKQLALLRGTPVHERALREIKMKIPVQRKTAAAEQLGKKQRAESYFRALLANCQHADGEAIVELRHAKALVSEH
jgi:hypothetical protein